MTREEEIKNKATAFADSLSDGLYYHSQQHKCREHGFIQGANWADSHPEEPSSEDLEEELRKILDKHYYFSDEDDELRSIPELAKYIAHHFAEWQKKKDKQLVGATQKISHQHGYDEGRVDMREEMMKDAVEGEYWDGSIYLDNRPTNYKDGDKLKLIIIKEE